MPVWSLVKRSRRDQGGYLAGEGSQICVGVDRLRYRVTKCHILSRPPSQLLLPRCYQNTPHQEHPGAPSVSPNPRVFVRIGPLGCAQVGPGDNS